MFAKPVMTSFIMEKNVVEDWSDYWMGFARHAATKSIREQKSGAALVGSMSASVQATAYNRVPFGIDDASKDDTWVNSAVANLLGIAASEGISTKDSAIYLTHFPSSTDAKLIVQAYVSHVYVDRVDFKGYDDSLSASAILREGFVQVHRV